MTLDMFELFFGVGYLLALLFFLSIFLYRDKS